MAMVPHQSSQGAEVPTLTTANAGDNEMTAVDRSISTTNGHADTVLEKKTEVLSSDAITIEPSFEEGEEKADDGAETRSVSSDDGDGPHDVSLNNDRPNVCFTHLPPSFKHEEAQDDFQGTHAVNEHQALSNRISTHDTNGTHSEPASPITPDVSPPYFCLFQALVRRSLGRKAHLPSGRAILSRFAADSSREASRLCLTFNFTQRKSEKSASHAD